MLGAIVAFSVQERVFSMHRRIESEQIFLPMHGASCFVFSLPCTAQTFEQAKPGARQRLMRRLHHCLLRSGIGCVYAPPSLRPFLKDKFFLPDGRRIFYAFTGQIIERHYQTFSFTPQTARVCIYANPFDQNALAAAQYMTQYTNRLCLVSADAVGAAQASELLFADCGLTVDCTENEKQLNRADFALLLTPPSIRICGAGLVLDFSGRYMYQARREVYFETAFGYAPLLRYFGRADTASGEFILCCYGLEQEKDLCAALLSIGWKKA